MFIPTSVNDPNDFPIFQGSNHQPKWNSPFSGVLYVACPRFHPKPAEAWRLWRPSVAWFFSVYQMARWWNAPCRPWSPVCNQDGDAAKPSVKKISSNLCHRFVSEFNNLLANYIYATRNAETIFKSWKKAEQGRWVKFDCFLSVPAVFPFP